MHSHRFDSLRERLLRAGVAPRHVRRYLRELGEHHEDAVRAELAKGRGLAAAREAAWERLGTEESLAQSMLERPELRSTAARFPALVFGVGPVLGWIGAPLAVAAALSLAPEPIRRAPRGEFVEALYVLLVLYARLLPVLLGAVALAAAASRRLGLRWPLIGTALVDLLAGSVVVYAFPGQLGVNSSLLPWLVPTSAAFGPKDPLALGEGLLRAACMLVLSLVLQRIARRLGRSGGLTPAAH